MFFTCSRKNPINLNLRIISSSNSFFQKQWYLTNISNIWQNFQVRIWQIWWYLITNSELFAEEIHLFAIKYHPFCQIPGSFVKYVKYLSNISVFDRNYLMKKWSFRHIVQNLSTNCRLSDSLARPSTTQRP